jgi:hypothetical protein
MKPLCSCAALLFFLVVCSKNPGNPSVPSTSCDDLGGSAYVPVTLGQVLCIGKDSSGTVFLVDQSGSIMRCFISRSDTFERVDVTGSSIMLQEDYSLTLADSIFSQIEFFNVNGNVQSASVCSGQSPVVHCESLSVLASAQLPGYPIRNFPASIFIEYLARDSLGNYFLATRSTHDWDGTLIVDFGQPGAMVKEQFNGLARGSSSRISLTIDGQQAIAYFPDVSSGSAYLQIGSAKRSLEIVQPTEQIMSTLGFNCWSEMRYYGYL